MNRLRALHAHGAANGGEANGGVANGGVRVVF
jgi:hypothetical protein